MSLARPLSRDALRKLKEEMLDEMERGLRAPDQPLRMLHSYVDHFPTGQERGDYVTIDFGGSNMRVMHVGLKGGRRIGCSGEKWSIPETLKRGCLGRDLFDWMAQKVQQVIDHEKSVSFSTSIGFCFSFPIHQLTINSATLLQWNKGFDIPDCIGQDVAAMLNDAFARASSPFRVGAIVNDTVAVLLGRSYESPTCMIGGVLGTGFNAAYWEDWKSVPKLAPDIYAIKMRTIINTEIGGFPLAIEDPIDIAIDRESGNPGKQCLEKRVSGMYLEKMFSLACSSRGLVLEDYSTETMGRVEAARAEGWELAAEISNRSVQYVACAVAAVHQRIAAPCELAMEGSVIERYPRYRERLLAVLRDVYGVDGVSIVIVDDYSAIGAAVAASMHKL